MAWFTDRHLFCLAVLFYGSATLYSVFLWRKGFRRDDWANYFLLATGVALHTGAMLQRGLTLRSCPVNNLYEATTFLLWALGLASLVYALLPKFNCGDCGVSTCMAFAAACIKQEKHLADCPYLDKGTLALYDGQVERQVNIESIQEAALNDLQK